MFSTSRAFSLALALPILAPATLAGADLTRSGGILGETVTYAMQGDPLEVYVLVPSFSPGPTPLAIFDPSDPRTIDVGVELSSFWGVGVLDGAGAGSVVLPLPPIPTLAGLPLYGQFVTAFGTTTIVDEISNQTSFVLAAHGDSTFAVSNVVEQNDGHSSTTLGNGNVLLAGGIIDDGLGNGIATNRYYLFDDQTQTFALSSATMSQARTQHTATLLADGRVLTLGGTDELTNVFATGEIYDPVTDSSAPIAPMSVARVGHTATLLSNGRVFVAGGTSDLDFSDLSLAGILALLGSVHNSTAVYNPATNSWSNGPNLPGDRALMSASRLGNGKVLLTGGLQVDKLFGVPTGASFITDGRLYDPNTNSLQNTADFSGDRALHAQITLANGDALVVGGVNGNLITQAFTPLATCRYYNTATETWTNKASLAAPRVLGNVFETAAGIVAIGGVETFDITTLSGTPNDSIEATDGAVLSWAATGNMIYPRALAISALIDGGTRILTTGTGDNGTGGVVADLTAEIHTP